MVRASFVLVLSLWYTNINITVVIDSLNIKFRVLYITQRFPLLFWGVLNVKCEKAVQASEEEFYF